MLSLLMLSREDMNRSEQESLYRTSRKLSLVPMDTAPSRRPSFSFQRGQHEGAGEDLVLSVLKSPVNHIGAAGGQVIMEEVEESCEFEDEVDSEEERHVFDDGR